MTKKIIWTIIPILLVISAIISGFFIYRWGLGDQQPKVPESENNLQTSQSPSPQPKTKLNKESLKIEVLNGAGISGTASTAKAFLEDAGYKNIETANASNYNFKTTLVEIKESKKDYIDTLIKDLSGKYEASASSDFLKEANSFDVVITIGAK